MGRKSLAIIIACMLFYGCASVQNNPPQTKSCPASCDDNNPCTNDICSATTNFECQHIPLNCTTFTQQNYSILLLDSWTATNQTGLVKFSSNKYPAICTLTVNERDLSASDYTLTESDLESYVQAWIYIYNKTENNFSLVSSKVVYANGVNGTEVIYTTSRQNTPMEAESVNFYKGTKRYNLVCLVPMNVSATVQPLFESMVNSFQTYSSQ